MNANMKWIPKIVKNNFLGPKQVWVPKARGVHGPSWGIFLTQPKSSGWLDW